VRRRSHRYIEASADIRLVLTDVEMPGIIYGVKLAHHIRTGAPIRLIVASGQTILEEGQFTAGSKTSLTCRSSRSPARAL
jgi:CheY-like chemotaxis protein